jgi:hypothetical protein
VRRLAIVLLVSGCSFIDDWGGFTTDPDFDAGGLDGGDEVDAGDEEDAGADAGGCPLQCDEIVCDDEQVCAIDPGGPGCVACFDCARCDGCTTQCVSARPDVPDDCYCDAGLPAGSACEQTEECIDGLICSSSVCVDPPRGGEAQLCTLAGGCSLPELECADPDGDGTSTCVRSCSFDGDCIGVSPECRGSFCARDERGEWEACDPLGVCNDGLTCRGLADISEPVCFRNCTSDDDCVGSGFTSCVDADENGTLECVPTPCDFVLDTGCPVGQVCRLAYLGSMSTNAISRCIEPFDLRAPDSPCDRGNQCASRYECLTEDSGVSFNCYQWCYTDGSTACVNGDPCEPFGASLLGRQIGACVMFSP